MIHVLPLEWDQVSHSYKADVKIGVLCRPMLISADYNGGAVLGAYHLLPLELWNRVFDSLSGHEYISELFSAFVLFFVGRGLKRSDLLFKESYRMPVNHIPTHGKRVVLYRVTMSCHVGEHQSLTKGRTIFCTLAAASNPWLYVAFSCITVYEINFNVLLPSMRNSF
jgi:hypothetical protein